jgi:hypothetical protein
MSHFLLPRTLSNSVMEDTTEPITSLDGYIKPLECTHPYSITLTDLMPMYSIQKGRTLFSGEEPEGLYPLIVDNGESLSLDLLKYQEPNGVYLSKLTNTTKSEAIQYLYKLSCSYKKVYLCKPENDCPTSSTKYIIAIHFLQLPEEGNLKIPYYFRMKLEDINSILGQIQLEHLRFKRNSLGKNINLSYGS